MHPTVSASGHFPSADQLNQMQLAGVFQCYTLNNEEAVWLCDPSGMFGTLFERYHARLAGYTGWLINKLTNST